MLIVDVNVLLVNALHWDRCSSLEAMINNTAVPLFLSQGIEMHHKRWRAPFQSRLKKRVAWQEAAI